VHDDQQKENIGRLTASDQSTGSKFVVVRKWLATKWGDIRPQRRQILNFLLLNVKATHVRIIIARADAYTVLSLRYTRYLKCNFATC